MRPFARRLVKKRVLIWRLEKVAVKQRTLLVLDDDEADVTVMDDRGTEERL